MDDTASTTFANHRGVVPMLWVFFSIAMLELLAMHLLLSLKWPAVAWPLSALTLLSIVWLVGWIWSWPRLPHRLEAGVLTLHMGSLRSLALPIDQIACIHTELPPGALNLPGTRNLVPIAHPNRIIELTAPLPGRRATTRIAIRLDDPAAFDAAMAGQGLAVS